VILKQVTVNSLSQYLLGFRRLLDITLNACLSVAKHT
jgi:hypothetical protein